MAEDPAATSEEWLAEFRSDVTGFLEVEPVEAATRQSLLGRAQTQGFYQHAYCAPSGGRSDAMTLALAHQDNHRSVMDLLRSVGPSLDTARVVTDFSDV